MASFHLVGWYAPLEEGSRNALAHRAPGLHANPRTHQPRTAAGLRHERLDLRHRPAGRERRAAHQQHAVAVHAVGRIAAGSPSSSAGSSAIHATR